MRTLAVIAWCVAVAGCSSAPADLEVTGQVTFDGQAVGTGNDARIRFDSADGKGKTGEAVIDKGKYAVRVPAGAYKVAVTWDKEGAKPAGPVVAGPGSGAARMEQVIPAKYNAATELKADVSADKAAFSFDLKK